jgi:NTE family protein
VDYRGEDAPRYDVAATLPRRRPSLALVLGGGGPRGFAHVGALKALSAAGVEAELVVGASVGAMVGALYAGGMSAQELEQLALDLNVAEFITLDVSQGVTGDASAIERFIVRHLGNRRIEELQRRFAATALRVNDGQMQVFNAGNLAVAVRASAALPGRFPPARILGVDYIDGDEATPLPAQIARALGAQVVVAVDVSAHLASTPSKAPQAWRERDQRRARAIAEQVPFADVVIHPDLGYYADIRDAYRRRSIALAEQVTREALPKIRQALMKAS